MLQFRRVNTIPVYRIITSLAVISCVVDPVYYRPTTSIQTTIPYYKSITLSLRTKGIVSLIVPVCHRPKSVVNYTKTII